MDEVPGTLTQGSWRALAPVAGTYHRRRPRCCPFLAYPIQRVGLHFMSEIQAVKLADCETIERLRASFLSAFTPLSTRFATVES